MNAIEVKNLTKKYKGFSLENLSFTLPGGCIMGLIGENGAGNGILPEGYLTLEHKCDIFISFLLTQRKISDIFIL